MPSNRRMPTSLTCSYPAWPVLEFLSFLLYLSIPSKLKFTPVRDHFPKCSEAKIKWTTGKKKRISSHNDDKTFNTAASAARIFNKEGQLLLQPWVLSNEPSWQATYSEFTFRNTTWLGLWNFQRSRKDVWKVTTVLTSWTLAFGGFGETTVFLICCLHKNVNFLPFLQMA